MQNERQIHDLIDQRFRLVEYIGGGGGGDVFKAVDTKHADKPVAIKLLRSSFGGDSKARQELFGRFNQEVWTTARLGEHPSIVTVLDSGVDNSQPYLVMEFLGAPPLVGTGLGDLIYTEGSIEPRRAVHLMKQVCSGLHYAHSFEVELETHTIRGIVHRDVKPSNIFILQDPMLGETVRILDFGISKTLSDITVTYGTQLVGFIGTLQYASPEQLRGKALDARSDIYSLGAVMYEMLTGDVPLFPETNTFPGWYEAHNYQPVRPFKEASPSLQYEIPAALEAVVLSCLEKSPDQRPETMQVLSQLLEESIRQPLAVSLYPETPAHHGSTAAVAPVPPATSPAPVKPIEIPLDFPPEPSPLPEVAALESHDAPAPSAIAESESLENSVLGFSEAEILALDGSELPDLPESDQQLPMASSPEFLFGFDQDFAEEPEEEVLPEDLKDFMYGFEQEGSSPTVVEDQSSATASPQAVPPVQTAAPPVAPTPAPEPPSEFQSMEDFLYGFDADLPVGEDASPTVVEVPGSERQAGATYLESVPPSATPSEDPILGATVVQDQPQDPILGATVVQDHSNDPTSGATVVQDHPDEQVSNPTVVEEKGAPGASPPPGVPVSRSTSQPIPYPSSTPPSRSTSQPIPYPSSTPPSRSTSQPIPYPSPTPAPSQTPVRADSPGGRPSYTASRTRTGYTSAPMTQRGAEARATQGLSRTRRTGRTTSGKQQTLDSGFSFWMKSLTSAAASLIDRRAGSIPLLKTLTGHRGWVMAVAFSPDGQMLATASGDSTIRFWDPSSGKLLQTLEGHGANVTCLAFSPDGRILASGSEDKTIKIWGVATGKLLRTITGHEGGVRCLAFSPLRELFMQKSTSSHPGMQQLASGGDDRIIKIWDVNSGNVIADLKGHTSVVTSLAFNPDGLLGLFLASASSDKTIRIWDIGTRELVRTLEGHTAGVWSVAFSPTRDTPLPNRPRGSKTLMVSGGEDRTIRVWDISSGRTLHTFSGHTSRVRSVIFSPDGSSVVSGSGDKTLKVWDMASGKLISTLSEHKFGIWSVAFCPTRIPSPIKPRASSYIMASGSGDNSTKLWLFTRF